MFFETHAPAFAPILGEAPRIGFQSFEETANFYPDLFVIRRSIPCPNCAVSGRHNNAPAYTRAGRAAARIAGSRLATQMGAETLDCLGERFNLTGNAQSGKWHQRVVPAHDNLEIIFFPAAPHAT